MNKKVLFVGLLFISIFFVSCKTNVEKKDIDTATKSEKILAADLKKVAINIEGMTCEIGCARTIQSKLSKTDGIKFAEVNFEEKKGIVEYDANKVSEKEIVQVVEQIAGGDLYKVVEIEATE